MRGRVLVHLVPGEPLFHLVELVHQPLAGAVVLLRVGAGDRLPAVGPVQRLQEGRNRLHVAREDRRLGRLQRRRQARQLQFCVIGAVLDRPLAKNLANDLPDALGGQPLLARDGKNLRSTVGISYHMRLWP